MPMEKNTDIYFKHESFARSIRIYLFLVISFVLIIIPTFLPLGFSPDSLNYYATINLSPSQFDFISFEPFYWLIVRINQILFNGSWTSYVLFFSFIYVILSVYLIKKYSISPFISLIIFVLLFYPIFGLIQIRDGVSMAFVWWAFFDLMEGKKTRFIIKTIIATLFHYASIIFLLFLFINKKRINRKFYFLLPIIGLILGQYVFSLGFFQLIINYLPDFLKFKAQEYLYLAQYEPESKMNQIHILNIYSLFVIIVYYFSLINFRLDKYFITFTKIIGFSIFFFLSLKTIPTFSFRIANDFYTFLVFLIPYNLKNFKKEEKYLVYLLFILMLILISWNIYIRHDIFDFSLL